VKGEQTQTRIIDRAKKTIEKRRPKADDDQQVAKVGAEASRLKDRASARPSPYPSSRGSPSRRFWRVPDPPT
jgi:hypothetical protein